MGVDGVYLYPASVAMHTVSLRTVRQIQRFEMKLKRRVVPARDNHNIKSRRWLRKRLLARI